MESGNHGKGDALEKPIPHESNRRKKLIGQGERGDRSPLKAHQTQPETQNSKGVAAADLDGLQLVLCCDQFLLGLLEELLGLC